MAHQGHSLVIDRRRQPRVTEVIDSGGSENEINGRSTAQRSLSRYDTAFISRRR